MKRARRIFIALALAASLVPLGACRRLPVRLIAADQSASPAERLSGFLGGADGVLVLAMRGLADPRPPDSELALRAAAEAGFDGVWIEVRGSSDGEPMVFGAETLDGATDGEGPLSALDAGALAGVTLTGPEDLPPSRLLSLERALGLFGERLILWIYIPSDQAGGEALAARVAALVQSAGAAGTAVLETDNPGMAKVLVKDSEGLHVALRSPGSGETEAFEDEMAEAFGSAPWPVTLAVPVASLGATAALRHDFSGLAAFGLQSEDDHYKAISAGANALLSERPGLGLSLVRGADRGASPRP